MDEDDTFINKTQDHLYFTQIYIGQFNTISSNLGEREKKHLFSNAFETEQTYDVLPEVFK